MRDLGGARDMLGFDGRLLATYKYHAMVVCRKQRPSVDGLRDERQVLQHPAGDVLVAVHGEVDVVDAAAARGPAGERVGREGDRGEDVLGVAVVGDAGEQGYAARLARRRCPPPTPRPGPATGPVLSMITTLPGSMPALRATSLGSEANSRCMKTDGATGVEVAGSAEGLADVLLVGPDVEDAGAEVLACGRRTPRAAHDAVEGQVRGAELLAPVGPRRFPARRRPWRRPSCRRSSTDRSTNLPASLRDVVVVGHVHAGHVTGVQPRLEADDVRDLVLDASSPGRRSGGRSRRPSRSGPGRRRPGSSAGRPRRVRPGLRVLPGAGA